MKKQKGITLLAMLITIGVMLLVVGVTVAILDNNSRRETKDSVQRMKEQSITKVQDITTPVNEKKTVEEVIPIEDDELIIEEEPIEEETIEEKTEEDITDGFDGLL